MEAKDLLVEITNEGTCLALWNDDNSLEFLGDLEVTRLSDVEYINEKQAWQVVFRNGTTLPGFYKQRIEALNAEITYAEEHLLELAEWAQTQIPAGKRLTVAPTYGYDPSFD